ncbi:MAG TPA: transglutaminase domain-containing protein [Candidatus Acidoferrales bacterium]|nr:transglutaminase domain-containing protein [Candidatus Acidoferrales bacterium]
MQNNPTGVSRAIPRNKVLPLILISFLIAGCGSPFLKMEEISKLQFSGKKETSIIYFRRILRFSENGELHVISHKLIRAGENINSVPDILETIDAPIYKLENFDGRIIKPDGTTINLGSRDLVTWNTSNKYILTGSTVSVFRITDPVESGDVIEEVDEHVNEFPALGIDFPLDEVGKAENVKCSIEVPNNLVFLYSIANDTIKPKISETRGGRDYTFEWDRYVPNENVPPLSQKNNAPEIIGTVYDSSSMKDGLSWKAFGDWYLSLISDRIKYDQKVLETAQEITKGLTDDRLKMDAIFNYCQKNVRYEQVYMNKGEEFIPHNCSDILERKFGDCKDYSCLIYALAKSVGIDPNLVLCFRGRGYQFYPDMPVSQFNHVIVHFNDNGIDRWYDGTDAEGIPGIVSRDLINQSALVLEKGNSRILKINESDESLVSINGDLSNIEDGFKGKLSVQLRDQYAVDFFFAHSQLNEARMHEVVIDWLRETLNNSANIKEVAWKTEPDVFDIDVTLEIPNSVTKIGTSTYTSLHSILPQLFPSELAGIDTTAIFYFPYYDRVGIQLDLKATGGPCVDADSSKGCHQAVHYQYEINPGPLQKVDRSKFMEDFHRISDAFNKTIRLKAGS